MAMNFEVSMLCYTAGFGKIWVLKLLEIALQRNGIILVKKQGLNCKALLYREVATS